MGTSINIAKHAAAYEIVARVQQRITAAGDPNALLHTLDFDVLNPIKNDAKAAAELLKESGSNLARFRMDSIDLELQRVFPRIPISDLPASGSQSQLAPVLTPTKADLGILRSKADEAAESIRAAERVAQFTSEDVMQALAEIAEVGTGAKGENSKRLLAVANDQEVTRTFFDALTNPHNSGSARDNFKENPQDVAQQLLRVHEFRQEIHQNPSAARDDLIKVLDQVADDLPTREQALQINELLVMKGVRSSMAGMVEAAPISPGMSRANYGMGKILPAEEVVAMQQDTANLRLAIQNLTPEQVRQRLISLTSEADLTPAAKREILAGAYAIHDALGPWSVEPKSMESGVLGGLHYSIHKGTVPFDSRGAAVLNRVLKIDGAHAARERLAGIALDPSARTDPRLAREALVLVRRAGIEDLVSDADFVTLTAAADHTGGGGEIVGMQRTLQRVATTATTAHRAPLALEEMLKQTEPFTDDQLDNALLLLKVAQREGSANAIDLSMLHQQIDDRLLLTTVVDSELVHLRRHINERFSVLTANPGADDATIRPLLRGQMARSMYDLRHELQYVHVKDSSAPLPPTMSLVQTINGLLSAELSPPIPPQARTLMERAQELLKLNVRRMNAEALPEGATIGPGRYPDQAELGKVLANLQLAMKLTEDVASAAKPLVW